MELKGKRVVITGAAKGIGKAIALRLAEAGCEILAADVDDAEGKQTIQEINVVSRGYYVHADISKEEDVRHLKHEADLLWDDVNILINNAAIQTEDPLFETKIADFRNSAKTHENILPDRDRCHKFSLPIPFRHSGYARIRICSL